MKESHFDRRMLSTRLSRRRFVAGCCLSTLSVSCSTSSLISEDTFSSEFVSIATIEELREYAKLDNVRVKLSPGVYILDSAESHKFIKFSGRFSHYDLTDVTILVDNSLFSAFGVLSGADGFYRVLDFTGNNITFTGCHIKNNGDNPGIISRNKIINVAASGVHLKNVEVTTQGSRPWGYGSLFGISNENVRKMNGIRVGWPAKNVHLEGCKIHMRAMGHGIFIQGAVSTLIENCHVDGLLKATNDILEEQSGFAFEQNFKTSGSEYLEGVSVAKNGKIIPNEMISLSEDGIRIYTDFRGLMSGSTIIKNCTVNQMRRGICTGLGESTDIVIDSMVTNCVAAGFNIGSGDILENCRADAKYSEALSCPYHNSKLAKVNLQILDSRAGLANKLLATINGSKHDVHLYTTEPDYVPGEFEIAVNTNRGYAFYQKKSEVSKVDSFIVNDTNAKLIYE